MWQAASSGHHPAPQAQSPSTDLRQPSQGHVCAPPVVHGDLQANPQRPVGRARRPSAPLRSKRLQHLWAWLPNPPKLTVPCFSRA